MTEELKQVSGETVADTGAMDSPVAPTVESSAIEGAAGSDSLVGQAARVITPPPAGQTEIVQLQPGEEFRLAANPASVQLVIDGDNLVMGFDLDGDGEPDSFVVLEDLVLMAGGGNPPALVVAGETIGTDLLVANAIALARVDDAGTAPLETAAGDTATGGGATEYSDNLGIPINLLEALDVIPPTELEFGLIDLEDEIVLLDEEEEVAPPPPPEVPDTTFSFDETPGSGLSGFPFTGDGIVDGDVQGRGDIDGDSPAGPIFPESGSGVPNEVSSGFLYPPFQIAMLSFGGFGIDPFADLSGSGLHQVAVTNTTSAELQYTTGDPVQTSGGDLVTSQGEQVFYLVDPTNPNLVLGVTGLVVFGEGEFEYDELVFAIHLDDSFTDSGNNLGFTYAEYQQIDHSDSTNDDESLSLTINFDVSGSGGTTSAQVTLLVEDDGPNAEGGEGGAEGDDDMLVYDETPGLQTGEETIVALPTGLTNFIGEFGVSVCGAAKDTIFFDYGMDQPVDGGEGEFVGGVSLTQADGTLYDGNQSSGLFTLDGEEIFLHSDEGNIVFGQTEGGDVIFAVYLDDTDAFFFSGPDNEASAEIWFVQFEPFFHPDGTDPNDQIDFSVFYTVTDFDQDTSTQEFTVKILDDGPSLKQYGGSVGVVEEEHLPLGNEDEDDLNTLDDDSDPDFDVTTTVATGDLSVLVDPGKDAPALFGLAEDTTPLEDQGLTSGGQALSYAFTGGGVLVGFVGAFNEADNSNWVFTLDLQEDGNWTFTLLDKLDHHAIPDADDVEDILAIDFSGMVEATDSDFDPVTLDPETFLVKIIDDVPEAVPEAVASIHVDEDELAVADGDLSDGITDGDGDTDEATFSGAMLSALVTPGADEPVTFALDVTVDGDAVQTTLGDHVYSKGDQVFFNDNGGVIEGVADGRVVFTLTDNGDGTFTFDLLDQLDHANGGDESTLTLDLTGAFEATDFDGDAVSFNPDSITVVVENDVPLANDDTDNVAVGGTTSGNVIEGGPDPDVDPASQGTQVADETGADESGVIRSLTFGDPGSSITITLLDDGTWTFETELGPDGSQPDGGAVSLNDFVAYNSTTVDVFFSISGGELTFRIGDSDGFEPVDDAGGTLVLDMTGADMGDYTYTPATSDPLFSEVIFTYELEDNDGDSVPATLTINLDDTPSFDAGTILVHDESDGLQSVVDDDANGTDEDDIDPTIGTLPSGLQTVLGDLSIGQGDIVGVAQDTITFSYGQNGPAASDPVALSLTTQGEQSTLFASNDSEGDGSKRPIYLYQTAAGVVVGVLAQWDGDSWEDPDTLNDNAVTPSGDYVEVDESLATIAFIVYLDEPVDLGGVDNDASADTYFVQNVAIWNDDPADDDESDGSIAFEDQSVSVVVTDADDDSVTGNFTVRVEDDGPVQADGAEGNTVYESELDNAQSVGTDAGKAADDKNSDTNGDDTVITGDLSVLVDFGTDGPGGFSLNPDTSGLPDTLTSQGAPIVYDVDGNTLWGYVELGGDGGAYDPGTDRAVFSLELQSSGLWTFTLIDQLDHIQPTFDTEISLDLSSAVVAMDSDGDSIVLDGGFTVVVSDDVPNDIDPEDGVVANSSSGFFVGDLDLAANVGADEEGDVVFNSTLGGTFLEDASNTQLFTQVGDLPITLLVLDDGHTLLATTNPGDPSDSDSWVFEATLEPGTDSYSITMYQAIDDGSGVTFDDFSEAPAGQNAWIGIDDPRSGTPQDENEDLLFTGADPDAASDPDTVNTSSTGIGTNNQTIVIGDTVRLDYLTNINLGGDTKDLNALTFDGHYTVNDSSYTIVQTGGPATNTVDTLVRVYDADNDLIFDGDPDDVQDDITEIRVFDDTGTLVGTWNDGNSTTTIDGITVTLDYLGSEGDVLVEGLLVDYEVFAVNDDGYNRMEITNVTAGGQANDTFDLGGFAVGSTTSGEPIDLSFDLDVEDYDEDTSDGQLDFTIFPEVSGGVGNDVLTSNGDPEFLVGGGGNDTMTGDAGGDFFVFSLAANEGSDEILDFDVSDGDVLSFTDVTDVDAPGGIDIEDVVGTFVNDGGGAGIDTLTLESGTVIAIHDIDSALSSIADIESNSMINGA